MRKWSLEIEKQVAEYEQVTEDVKRTVKSLRDEALLEAKWEEEKVEEEKRKRRFEEELKLEEARMEIKREFEKKLEEDKSKSAKESGAKLPKLTMPYFKVPIWIGCGSGTSSKPTLIRLQLPKWQSFLI